MFHIKEGHQVHMTPVPGHHSAFHVYHLTDEGAKHVATATQHPGTKIYNLQVHDKNYDNRTDRETIVGGLRNKHEGLMNTAKHLAHLGSDSHSPGVNHDVTFANIGLEGRDEHESSKKPTTKVKKKMKKSVTETLDELVKSVEDHLLEKMNPVVAGALTGAVAGGIKGAMGSAAKKSTDLEGHEELSKPPVSEAQRKAMHAAASGNSTLDIPKSVGKDFAAADKGGKLPKKVKKSEDEVDKAAADGKPKIDKPAGTTPPAGSHPGPAPTPPVPKTLDYSKMKTPKTPESNAPTISYSSSGNVTRTPGAADAGFKTPKEKMSTLRDPKFRTHLASQRQKYGIKKSELYGTITGEELTKSMRSQHTDGEISEMIKAAVDADLVHRNVLIEWSNFRTINPALLELSGDDEEEV